MDPQALPVQQQNISPKNEETKVNNSTSFLQPSAIIDDTLVKDNVHVDNKSILQNQEPQLGENGTLPLSDDVIGQHIKSKDIVVSTVQSTETKQNTTSSQTPVHEPKYNTVIQITYAPSQVDGNGGKDF